MLLTLFFLGLFQRLLKCSQTVGFDVIGIISANVENLCKVNSVVAERARFFSMISSFYVPI